MDDLYDLVKEKAAFRKQKAAECGIGFELPISVSIVPNVPETGYRVAVVEVVFSDIGVVKAAASAR